MLNIYFLLQYGYTPRECLLNVDLPGRNEECEKFETMLASCKWDTVSSESKFFHIIFCFLLCCWAGVSLSVFLMILYGNITASDSIALKPVPCQIP